MKRRLYFYRKGIIRKYTSPVLVGVNAIIFALAAGNLAGGGDTTKAALLFVFACVLMSLCFFEKEDDHAHVAQGPSMERTKSSPFALSRHPLHANFKPKFEDRKIVYVSKEKAEEARKWTSNTYSEVFRKLND